MKRNVFKAIRKQFDLGMGHHFPQFNRVESTTREHCLYKWAPNESINCFIYVYPDRKLDCFYVEAAVSNKANWPSLLLPFLPSDEFINGEIRFRITRLWEPFNNDNDWWVGKRRSTTNWNTYIDPTAKELLENVPIVVKICLGRIETDVIPYFLDIVAGSGDVLKTV